MRNLDQFIAQLIAPLRNQVANMLARVLVTSTDNSTATPRMQVTAEDGSVEDVEHFQPYGLSAVPPSGSDGVLLCVGGDRSVPIAVAVSEPGTRPIGQVSGEVALYHREGHIIHLRKNGDIEIQCGPGRRVYLNDGSGGEPLATLADVDAVRRDLHQHEHEYEAPLHPSLVQPGITTNGPSVTAPTGTQVVRGK